MHAATIVGYVVNGPGEICSDCFPEYIEAAVDARIERLDELGRQYGWSKAEHDRDMIRTDIEHQELEPIFASSEMDRYPTCDECGLKIEDVQLTEDGLAYERRSEHAHLEDEEDRYEPTPEQRAYRDAQPDRLEKRGLKFGVIYSVDLAHDEAGWIKCYQPWGYRWPGGGKDGPPYDVVAVWTKTEGDDSYEYDHLGDGWVGGIHRKYLACLDKEQFKAFMDLTNLRFETDATGGSIGGPTPDEPNGGVGWQPAVSFDAGEGGAFVSAYVTPFWVGAHIPDDRDWDRIIGALRSRYS
jgi:hypothetical protein